MGVKIKPEFVELFRRSQAVSSEKGKSHFLTRTPKTTKAQKRLKELEEKKESDFVEQPLNKKIVELKFKVQELEDLQRENDENLDKLSNLYKFGIIDENGNPINNQIE